VLESNQFFGVEKAVSSNGRAQILLNYYKNDFEKSDNEK